MDVGIKEWIEEMKLKNYSDEEILQIMVNNGYKYDVSEKFIKNMNKDNKNESSKLEEKKSNIINYNFFDILKDGLKSGLSIYLLFFPFVFWELFVQNDFIKLNINQILLIIINLIIININTLVILKYKKLITSFSIYLISIIEYIFLTSFSIIATLYFYFKHIFRDILNISSFNYVEYFKYNISFFNEYKSIYLIIMTGIIKLIVFILSVIIIYSLLSYYISKYFFKKLTLKEINKKINYILKISFLIYIILNLIIFIYLNSSEKQNMYSEELNLCNKSILFNFYYNDFNFCSIDKLESYNVGFIDKLMQKVENFEIYKVSLNKKNKVNIEFYIFVNILDYEVMLQRIVFLSNYINSLLSELLNNQQEKGLYNMTLSSLCDNKIYLLKPQIIDNPETYFQNGEFIKEINTYLYLIEQIKSKMNCIYYNQNKTIIYNRSKRNNIFLNEKQRNENEKILDLYKKRILFIKKLYNMLNEKNTSKIFENMTHLEYNNPPKGSIYNIEKNDTDLIISFYYYPNKLIEKINKSNLNKNIIFSINGYQIKSFKCDYKKKKEKYNIKCILEKTPSMDEKIYVEVSIFGMKIEAIKYFD